MAPVLVSPKKYSLAEKNGSHDNLLSLLRVIRCFSTAQLGRFLAFLETPKRTSESGKKSLKSIISAFNLVCLINSDLDPSFHYLLGETFRHVGSRRKVRAACHSTCTAYTGRVFSQNCLVLKLKELVWVLPLW